MTEPPLLPPPDSPAVIDPAPGRSRRDIVPWLYGLGFLVLAVAIFYVWQYSNASNDASADDKAAVQAVMQRLADIDARLNKLEQRPTPDLGKITARLDALDGRVADQTQLATRLDAMSGRIEALSGREQTGIEAIKQQVNALAPRIAAIESSAGSSEGAARRLDRVARLQEASLALANGRAIGDVPDAPEALVRYAHSAPPTDVGLRLRFSQAEAAALAAPQPDESDVPFLGRVWDRAQGLVTIRRGENVVIGNPSAVILNRARTAIDAGDLAGAIEAVASLNGPPRQAMAAWLSDAQALQEARKALAQLATQA